MNARAGRPPPRRRGRPLAPRGRGGRTARAAKQDEGSPRPAAKRRGNLAVHAGEGASRRAGGGAGRTQGKRGGPATAYAYIFGLRGAAVSPGIGLMKRRIETEESAVSLAVSAASKRYPGAGGRFETLETLYHEDSGDWYVALGWGAGSAEKAVVRMDSVLGTVTDISEAR